MQHARCPIGLHFLSACPPPPETRQETRREGLVNVPHLSLESFLFPKLPWRNLQECPRYCLSWGRQWKERGIELPLILDSICFLRAEEGKREKKKKKKNSERQHHNTPHLQHLTIQPLSALVLGPLNHHLSLMLFFLCLFNSSYRSFSLCASPLQMFSFARSLLDLFVPWRERFTLFLFC